MPVAAWYPPPTHEPAKEQTQGHNGRGITALVLAVFGVLLGLTFGVPGMILGTIAYFLGRSAVSEIDASGATRNRSVAVSARILGIVAMAIGSIVTLVWFVVLLVVVAGPTTTG